MKDLVGSSPDENVRNNNADACLRFSQLVVMVTSHLGDSFETIYAAVAEHFPRMTDAPNEPNLFILTGMSADALAATSTSTSASWSTTASASASASVSVSAGVSSQRFEPALFEQALANRLSGFARFHVFVRHAPFLLTQVHLSSTLPVFTCSSPELHRLFPALLTTLAAPSTVCKHVSTLDANRDLSESFRCSLKRLAYDLLSICRGLGLDVARSCFTAGFTSTVIGNLIAKTKGAERKDQRKATLLILDRTLDVAAPLLQAEAPLLQVVSEREVDPEIGKDLVGTASLRCSYDGGANALLHELLFRPEALAKQAAKRRFQEIFGRELEEDFAVEALVEALEEQPSGWLARLPECQVLAFVCSWMRGEDRGLATRRMKREERLKYEKEVLKLEDRTNLLVLMNILVKSRERRSDLFDILILAIIAYSVVGETPGFDADIQEAFETSLKEAVEADVESVDLLESAGFPKPFSFDRFKAGLQEVATMRRKLFGGEEKDANSARDAMNQGGEFTPVLSQIVKDAFASAGARRTHLNHAGKEFSVEQTAMDLLKTGFNVLGFQGRKAEVGSSITTHDVWVIFVVGGLSWFEVSHLNKTLQQLRDAGVQNVPSRVLIGGTTITSTSQVLQGLFSLHASEPTSVYADLFS